jgi:hypothetical protein
LNRSILSRVLSVLFFCYIAGYAACLLYSVITFNAGQALPAFQWQYESRNAFALFFDYAVAIHVSGILIALSLGGSAARSRTHIEPVKSFSRLAASTLAAFIVLTVAYTALYEVVLPVTRATMKDITYKSDLGREFKALALKSAQAGDFSGASAYADLYLRIDSKNSEILAKKQDWDSRALGKKEAPAMVQTETASPPMTGLDAGGLLDRANTFYKNGDYYSAYYYATQAHTLDPRRTDAVRMAAQSMEKITSMTLSAEEKGDADLYKAKKKAFDAYNKGTWSESLAAYYSFLSLSKTYPKDKDIAEYVELSRNRVQEQAVFIDQAEKALLLPGTQSILFINNQDSNGVEAVAIDKLVETPDGLFAMDVEVLRYTPAGRVISHFTARYGELKGNSLLLRAVDRNKPAAQYFPLYSAGSSPAPNEANILKLTPTVEEMTHLTVGRTGAPEINFARLLILRGRLQGFGVSAQAISSQIVMDVLMPFVFLILSFFAMASGWALRTRYLARPPLPLYIFLPLVPVVALLVSSLWVYAHKILLGFVLLAFGLGAALAVCAAAELILLIVSLILLAGQSSG